MNLSQINWPIALICQDMRATGLFLSNYLEDIVYKATDLNINVNITMENKNEC